VVESFASPGLTLVQDGAVRLSERLGVEPSPPLLRSIALASVTRGDYGRATRIGAELRARGRRDTDDVLVVEAEYILGIAEFWQGVFAAAGEHFEAAVAGYRAADRDVHLVRYGLDPRIVCMSRLANTHWFRGRYTAAVQARDTALAWADEVGHPASRSTALVFAALLSLELGDNAGLRRYTAALNAQDGEHDLLAARLTGRVLAGYADVLDGRSEPGLASIQRELDGMSAVGPAPGARACHLRVMLAACAHAHDAPTGLATADLLLSTPDGAVTWEAEARRVRAQFLARLGAPASEVAAELDRALAVARRQGARLFELRTATTMLAHDPTDGAHDRLAHIVADLDDARGTPDGAAAVTLLGVGPGAERHGERSRNATSPTV
jgi:hypothetical protein